MGAGNITSGTGYSTNCDNLVTDGDECTQTCLDGYAANANAGVYTCPKGNFTGTKLVCTGNHQYFIEIDSHYFEEYILCEQQLVLLKSMQ